MKITAESTARTVELEVGIGRSVEARVWEATTEQGVRCYLLVTRIAVANEDDQAPFKRELQERPHAAPSARAIEAFPIRLVL